MNVRFLNPFIEAAHEVLKADAGVNVERGELGLEQSAYQTDDITVIIALVGEVEGTVYFGLDNRTAIKLASKMIGDDIPAFNSLAQSGIAELGNVITGRASVKLAQAGYEATISPPTMLLGRGATISTLDFARLVVPLHTDCGPLNIHLALREGSKIYRNAAAIPVPSRPNINS
jgi:chemotaxis protein CheX